MKDNKVYLTDEGFLELEEELNELKNVRRPEVIKALKEAGIEYVPYFVTGSHDWFCWPAMFEYFAEHILWK